MMNKRILKVVEYSQEWPKLYQHEKQKLQFILGDILLNSHHIGSTSVPGIHAKPVIDILLEVTNLVDLDSKNTDMTKEGYIPKGENGIEGRRYFQKGKFDRTHHVHAFQKGNYHCIKYLAFRDYLREHKTIAKEYGELKLKILKECKNDTVLYCNMKDPFIKDHEKKALSWYNQKH